jgi:ribonuclease HI
MSFPQASNNEAEYEALLHEIKMAKACGATRLKIFGDSNLVVQQVMNRCDTINDNMMAYKNLYHYLEGTFDGYEVSHISRNNNEEADNLANIGSQCLLITLRFKHISEPCNHKTCLFYLISTSVAPTFYII